ncbi:MAG TPA: UDP-N-acetylglucosamine 1-carboxyvinyltransferase [Acidimicrobiia bacterium]|jgi:UDP-N-acetylglucosamine 1-carboxyvinyltransferase
MSRIVVRGGGPLEGRVAIAGATKNEGTKLMAAALLARGRTIISNIPRVGDLDIMIELLRVIGARVDWVGEDELAVDAAGDLEPVAPYELVSRMRASINVLGPLVARCGEARVALPGGDAIGSRKLDMHLDGLRAMGATVEQEHGYVVAHTDGPLLGTRHVLEFPSVGATENLLMAGALAKGVTVIDNAAREPEVTELCAFLNRMGGHVLGGGTSCIEVHGAEELEPTEMQLIGDRIEVGTLLIACAMAGGEIELEGAQLDHVEIMARKLADMGMLVSPTANGIWARASQRLRAVDVATLPFPGFATDLMPPAVAMLTVCDGSGIVTENIYESRFQFVDELVRMGADVRHEGRHAIVRGVERLQGAPVQATDVRAGAALVLAGLVAEGETVVHDCDHVDRAYVDLAASLRALGADARGEESD